MTDPIRLFISYSHKDEAWLLRLKDVLKPLTRSGGLDPWDDKRIAAGEDWRAKIDQALEAAHAAILIVSTSFLASDFINDVEMTRLLKRRVQGMGFFWIPITDTLYEETALEGIQAAWDPKKPLGLIQNPAEQDGALVEIARKIKPLLNISKEEYFASRIEETGTPPRLSDNPGGVMGDGRPRDVVMNTASAPQAGNSDTDRVLLSLVDRSRQESPIRERALALSGPTFFIVPGPKAQRPDLFIRRLQFSTCLELSESLKKAGRAIEYALAQWPSFPRSSEPVDDVIDLGLGEILSYFKSRLGLIVDRVDGEASSEYAMRVLRAVGVASRETLRVFVFQLFGAMPGHGECETFGRFAALWEKFRVENAGANILVVFVVTAGKAEFKANYGKALADLKHAAVLMEMPNIVYADITSWLTDNRLSASFDIAAIDALAQVDVPPDSREGLQMEAFANKAERWLSDHRIKR